MQVGVARLLIIFLMAIFIQRGLIVSVLIISVSNWILTRHLQKKHDVTALFGMEVRENKTEYNNRKYYNYDPALLTYDLIDERVLSNTLYRSFGKLMYHSIKNDYLQHL